MLRNPKVRKYLPMFSFILLALGIFTIPFFVASFILFSPHQGTTNKVVSKPGETEVPIVPPVTPIEEESQEPLNLKALQLAKAKNQAKKGLTNNPTPTPVVEDNSEQQIVQEPTVQEGEVSTTKRQREPLVENDSSASNSAIEETEQLTQVEIPQDEHWVESDPPVANNPLRGQENYIQEPFSGGIPQAIQEDCTSPQTK